MPIKTKKPSGRPPEPPLQEPPSRQQIERDMNADLKNYVEQTLRPKYEKYFSDGEAFERCMIERLEGRASIMKAVRQASDEKLRREKRDARVAQDELAEEQQKQSRMAAHHLSLVRK